MNLISYNDLARMRLRDFVPEHVEIDVEESGMHVCVGHGGYEQLGENYFGWKQGEPFQTAEVTIDLQRSSALSMEIAQKIIKKLGLPLTKGNTASELIKMFGKPQVDEHGQTGTHFLRFICGKSDQYLLGCFIDVGKGLNGFYLARKDYHDEAESI